MGNTGLLGLIVSFLLLIGTIGEVPHWTGYSLGYELTRMYLQNHPEQKASTHFGDPVTSLNLSCPD